jgi:glucose-1-phosphate thymidylyltransferase
MWAIIPAAGAGSRIQPLAFSKELLPVGSRLEGDAERPRAVSEYLIERMVLAGADHICFVVAPGKSDILEYYGNRPCSAHISFTVQQRPAGLCDAIFRALPLIPPDEFVIIGLPDTIWFPEDALRHLGDDPLSFLLFPVDQPERFDTVLTDALGQVREIKVKQPDPGSSWIWGAFKLSGQTMRSLYDLWCERDRRDEYMGTLVNAYLDRGGRAVGVRAGQAYVDVGTLDGYREAIRVLSARPVQGAEALA